MKINNKLCSGTICSSDTNAAVDNKTSLTSLTSFLTNASIINPFSSRWAAFILAAVVMAYSATCHSQGPLRQAIESCFEMLDSTAKLACYDNISKKLRPGGESDDSVGNEASAGSEGEGESGPSRAAVKDSSLTESYQQTPSALDQRFDFEKQAADNQFIIIPHRPNYILLYSYNENLNDTPSSPSREAILSSFEQKHSEAKFQISFKVQLGRNLLPEPMSLWFAYTQLSFWQVYNRALSAPFRESNYEPELLFHYRKNFNLFGYSSDHFVFGFSHQSNGRAEPLSRSWNRVYSQWIFSQGSLSLSVKPWWRIPEARDEDDNPNIHNYLGYATFGSTYKSDNDIYDVRLYNNFRSENNRTTIQLSYSFPLKGRLKGYIQYFNGYGESLLDYNHRVKRIGVGILLTDWY